MQSALNRRQEILNILMIRRRDTIPNLAFEFNVSERTIKRDISILSHDHSIETKRGNGGGIRVAEGYYADRRYLNEEQENMLRKILPDLSSEDQIIMDEILKKFSKPKEKEHPHSY